ncbi:MAG TPA: M1 family metallopeptidase [Micromonosporaceae bacterium]|nr:M1 family metallopeptidase [Micromonosporaceae bacterium]
MDWRANRPGAGTSRVWSRVAVARAAAAAALAAALLAGCTSPPVIAPLPTPTPSVNPAGFSAGGEGIGDPYYPKAGNGGYDVTHYDLDVRYEPDTDRLSGTARITATATIGLSRFNLDLTGLTVERVTVNGADARADHDDSELVITPAEPIPAGSEFVVEIVYAGVPETLSDPGLGSSGFMHTDDGAVAIGEPEVASSWFPVNDHPRDKATYTITITAPDDLSAISNGVLRGKSSEGGFTTWEWEMSDPMAPYLATMVVGEYRVHESTHDGLPVFIAVDVDLPTSVDSELSRSGEVVDFLEEYFGPYPFDAIGGIAIDDRRIRFALENQSRPIYGPGFFGGGDASWVVVHELAHQWYGNSVALHEWGDIWLNEGFASYAEWLWAEERGEQTAQQTFDVLYSQAQNSIWSVPPGEPGPADLFSSSVYVRGAMAVHALRVTVGDEDFFAILKAWATEKAHSNGTTEEFIALAERISGEQLDDLFDAWLFQDSRPPRP